MLLRAREKADIITYSAFFLKWLWFVKCENLTKASKAGFHSFPFCALFNLWFPHGSDGNCFWSVQGTYVQSITFSKVSKPSLFVSSWMWKWVTLIRVQTTYVFRRQILFRSLKKIQTWLIRQHIFKGTYLLRTRTLQFVINGILLFLLFMKNLNGKSNLEAQNSDLNSNFYLVKLKIRLRLE